MDPSSVSVVSSNYPQLDQEAGRIVPDFRDGYRVIDTTLVYMEGDEARRGFIHLANALTLLAFERNLNVPSISLLSNSHHGTDFCWIYEYRDVKYIWGHSTPLTQSQSYQMKESCVKVRYQ